MRTTIDLEGDVLLAAKEIARQRRTTIGKVISDLARQAMTQPVAGRPGGGKTRAGIPQFPLQPDAGPITLDLVNRLRDESP